MPGTQCIVRVLRVINGVLLLPSHIRTFRHCHLYTRQGKTLKVGGIERFGTQERRSRYVSICLPGNNEYSGNCVIVLGTTRNLAPLTE